MRNIFIVCLFNIDFDMFFIFIYDVVRDYVEMYEVFEYWIGVILCMLMDKYFKGDICYIVDLCLFFVFLGVDIGNIFLNSFGIIYWFCVMKNLLFCGV